MENKENRKNEQPIVIEIKGFRISNLLTSIKSMVAMATLSIIGIAVAQPSDDINSPVYQLFNFEVGSKNAGQFVSSDIIPIYNDYSLSEHMQKVTVPKQEDLSMLYTVDPLTISNRAKVGKFPLFPQADGSLGIPVMPLSEMSDNTPKEFFDYTKYYFNSGVVKGTDGGPSYMGYANTHVAIAVDPDNSVSVAKIKELNEFLTDKIKGDSANGVAGWAEKYGLSIDAIVPIYIDNKKSVALSDAYYGCKDLTLTLNDIIATVNNHVVYLDVDNQGFKDPNRLSILLEGQLKDEAYYYTRAEHAARTKRLKN